MRQVLGWREFLWGVYRTADAGYAQRNALDAQEPLPPAFTGCMRRPAMRCVDDSITSVRQHAYAHHIQRLMVLANLATLAGVRPDAMTDWMHGSFIDALRLGHGPQRHRHGNVRGRRRGSRPSPTCRGGAYIDRMSLDYCKPCRYDRTKRTGEDACPFTTLYWDFLDRNPRDARCEPPHRPGLREPRPAERSRRGAHPRRAGALDALRRDALSTPARHRPVTGPSQARPSQAEGVRAASGRAASPSRP